MDFEIITPTTPTRLPLIVHLPHASTHIPAEYRSQILLDDDALAAEHLKMADLHTDQLFAPLRDLGATLFVNRVSRLLCDPERFLDETREKAADHGMGAVYLKTHDHRDLRRPDFSPQDREAILNRFYHPYHQALSRLTAELLEEFGQVWILDGHSFPSRPHPFEDAGKQRPPFCLGFDDFHEPEGWVGWWRNHIDWGGFATNEPFEGSFVPDPYYAQDSRVRSFMLEVRRDLFTDEATGQYLEEEGRLTGSMGPHREVFHHGWGTDFRAFLRFLTRDVRARSKKPGAAISRELALEWAESELRREHPDWRIREVVNYSEVLGGGVLGPRLYNIGEETLQRCWIAYVDDGAIGMLRSSTIILIDGETGQILYFGSAYDEG